VTKNIDTIVEDLSSLTVLEMSKLKEMLENKWGVKAQAAVAVAQAPVAQAAAPQAASESTEFQVTVTEAPADKKIGVIKVLREITGLGLKEAKDIVEALPKVIKETAPKTEAEEMKKKLEAAGAKVSLKGL
jgi:large subunit ribosomal protein L7/L12